MHLIFVIFKNLLKTILKSSFYKKSLSLVMNSTLQKAQNLKEEILLNITNANLEEGLKLLVDLALMSKSEDISKVYQLKFQKKKLDLENIEGILSRDQFNLET